MQAVVFAGRVSSGDANEVVDVLARDCGAHNEHLVASRLVRGATLVRKASLRWGAFNHQATFTVPTRRLRLRAFLPEASASPCYVPGGSAPWRS